MEKECYISVGIPFYNSEKYLAQAIQSVINQSYPYWELILVDDGSTDASLEIAHKFAEQDDRIRVISDQKNLKLPTRLNQLIDESRYNYIARMDSDDLMHPLRLETQINFLINNVKYDLVSSGIISIDSENKIKGIRNVTSITSVGSIAISYPISHPSVMAKKEWFKRNKYETQYPRAEDFELWTRAISKEDFKIAILPDLLLFYREEGNLSIDKLVNSYNQVIEIYKKYHGAQSNLVKVRLKKYFVIILNKLNLLQKIRAYSNKSLDSKISDVSQRIILTITKNKN